MGADLAQLGHALVDVREVPFDQRGDVFAWRFATGADVDDLRDLGDGEACRLRGSHEAQYRERVVVVVAVAGTGAGRFGDEPGLLPVPDGLGRHATAFAQLTDAHDRTLDPLDLPVHGRV